MAYAAADVLYIQCDRHRLHGLGPKPKYLLCIHPARRLFFFINSMPYRKLMASQVQVTSTDLPFLTNPVSYIDTRTMAGFNYNEIEPQIRADPWRLMGTLPDHLIELVKSAGEAHGLLPGWQEDILLNL